MASAQTCEEEEVLVPCGSCGEVESYLLTPKCLPCQHIFCVACLEGHQTDEQLIKCFTCDSQCEGRISDLPPALEKPDCYCDPCKKKGVMTKTAKVFCTKCEHKYCANHEEAHNDLNEGHNMISIKAYRDSSFSDEVRYCENENHKSEPVTIGCKICWVILCPLCISSSGNCKSAPYCGVRVSAHERIMAQAFLRIQTTLSLSQWDTETEQCLSTIHKARDEQVREINAKYAALEDEYRRSRSQSQETLIDYGEKIGTKLAQLQECLKNMRTDISKNHVVDVVKRRESYLSQMNRFLREEPPAIPVFDQHEIARTDAVEHRDIEMKLVPVAVPLRYLQTSSIPKSIEFNLDVAVPNNPKRACHHKGFTFISDGDCSIKKISHDGCQATIERFASVQKYPVALLGHEDRLYVLAEGKPFSVYAFDLEGRLLNFWDHPDFNTGGSSFGRAITVINNELVIADRSNKEFCIYNLTGEFVRSVQCSILNKNKLAICHAGGDSIIVANVGARPELFKINLSTGQLEWECNDVINPSWVAMLNKDIALVSDAKKPTVIKLYILDQNTGKIVGKLTDPKWRPSAFIRDIWIDGNTVIIPRHKEHAVLYYDIVY